MNVVELCPPPVLILAGAQDIRAGRASPGVQVSPLVDGQGLRLCFLACTVSFTTKKMCLISKRNFDKHTHIHIKEKFTSIKKLNHVNMWYVVQHEIRGSWNLFSLHTIQPWL